MRPFSVPLMDYVPVFAPLIFEECETRRCVDISIEDDMTQETIESFNVTLDRPLDLDSRIHLDPVIGVIRIIDDSMLLTGQCIRESVDSLCRDDADMSMPPYIRKACNRPNAAFVSLFR